MEKTLNEWGTYDVGYLNAVLKLPEQLRIAINVYDCERKELVDRFLWDEVCHFGFNDVWHHSHQLTFKVEAFEFEVNFVSDEDQFYYKVTPKQVSERYQFFISANFVWHQQGTITNDESGLKIETGHQTYRIEVIGEKSETLHIPVKQQGILVKGNQIVHIFCNMAASVEAGESLWIKQLNLREKTCVTGGGTLIEAPSAIVQGMTWNTIYDGVQRRLCTPVTRKWCVPEHSNNLYGEYVLFAWDTFFGSLLYALQDEGMATRQILSVIEEACEGIIPQFGSQKNNAPRKWLGRSNPPVGAFCALKIYRQFGNKELLEQIFATLLSWNQWWMTKRDGNGDGLLEWGHNGTLDPEQRALYKWYALLESGVDNGPVYDEVAFNMETQTLELADVGLNSLYALDCWALAEIAKILKDENNSSLLTVEYNRIKRLMNEQLWNEELGIYCDRHWAGHYSEVLTPMNFYPLLAGIADEDKASRMVTNHLLDPNSFWGEYVIPSVSKKQPAFLDNEYWRGRIWAPTNFLVYEGLKRYGFDGVANEFAGKSLKLFLGEWKTKTHIHENFNAITGAGDDVQSSDPFYTWGGLLPYIAICELIEAEPWGGLRIGNKGDEEMSISNYPYQKHRLTIEKHLELKVSIDDEVVCIGPKNMIISDFQLFDNRIQCTVDCQSNEVKWFETQFIVQGHNNNDV